MSHDYRAQLYAEAAARRKAAAQRRVPMVESSHLSSGLSKVRPKAEDKLGIRTIT
jgi:hypothetical protein